ncbi:MAG TPA: pitrilysin family protein [Cyclobacteriaceae bacterium]|nr:pitrilysin family protein [Cyclobacteriaceae bacterium]
MKSIFKLTVLIVLLLSGIAMAPIEDGAVKEFTVGGIKVIFKSSTKEVVSARLFIRGGAANYSKADEGIEALTLNVVTEGGTKSLSMTEYGTALEQIGAAVSYGTSLDYSTIDLSCIKTYWDDSWKLFADAIVNPRFDQKSFDIVKGKIEAGAKENESNPDAYLDNKSMEMAFAGKNYSKIPYGTPTSLSKITLEQVMKHYQKIAGKQNVFLVVVGNVTEADLTQKINATLSKLGNVTSAPAEPRPLITQGVTIENRDIATNYIKGMMSVPSLKDKDGVPIRLAMSIMGDRFFVELRTKRSLTYAPAAYYTGNLVSSPQAVFYASSTDPKQTLQVMVSEINNVKNQGFTEKELKDKKERFLTGHYSRLETNDTQSMWLGVAEITGSWKYTETFMSDVDKVTVKDLNTVFNKYSNSINWMYLGKESAVSKDDFKQPQMLPTNSKVSPKK